MSEIKEAHQQNKILFLPGLLCDHELWVNQTKAAKTHGYVPYVADLTRDDTVEEMAKSALAAIDGDFDLCGLSMGGYVAMEIMRQAPERVKKLIIIASSSRQDSADKKEQRKGLIELAQKGRFKGVTPRLLPLLIHESRLGDKHITQPILDMAERVGLQAFLNQQNAILSRTDSRPYLPKIQKSSLIISGLQDQITPPDCAEEMAHLIPNSQLVLLDDCGHLPPMEWPEKVNQAIFAFLQS